MRTHAGGPGPRRGRFRAFHGEEINASCLHCPCARGKLPKPTSRVGHQESRTPLSRPPTLGTAAAGPVTPAGRVGGRDARLETFLPAKNDGRLTQWQSVTTRGGPGKPASYFYTDDVSIVVYSNSVLIGNSDFADSTSFSLSALGPKSSSVDLSGWRYR